MPRSLGRLRRLWAQDFVAFETVQPS